MEENNRKDKIKNSLLDTATDEMTNAGNEAVRVVFRDIKEWKIGRASCRERVSY